MSDSVRSFSYARKRTAKVRIVDVIDLEPLAMVELKGKGTMNPLKRKAESSTLLGEKLMSNAMKGTRTLRRLAGLQAHITGGTIGGTMRKAMAVPREVDKENLGEGAYIPYWNVNKSY